jgi:hypothetical protein
MTPARQQRKFWIAAAFAAALGVGLPAAADSPPAGTRERVVVDWHTGLAINGFDPVAYFTDGKPRVGSGEFEFRFAGAVWRFCNAGNRDAFAARPDVYMPQFGGYDPVAAARGVALPGNPLVWEVMGERLYLFYNPAARSNFDDDPDRVLGAAERKWTAIRSTLTP